MAVFVIERRFAEALNPTAEGAKEINLINDEEGVRWLYSFLSMDRPVCAWEILFGDRHSGGCCDRGHGEGTQ